jgi:hypothetical protein
MDGSNVVRFLLGAEVEILVTDLMVEAILTAQHIRLGGGTKMKAAKTVYPEIVELPRESICFVFHKGAGLTTRGALSYFYRMRRHL